MHAPVILGAPVHYEFSQICEVRAVPPASAGDLVRPADAIQPRAEIGERCLWDSNGEGRKFQDDLPSSAAPSVLVYGPSLPPSPPGGTPQRPSPDPLGVTNAGIADRDLHQAILCHCAHFTPPHLR